MYDRSKLKPYSLWLHRKTQSKYVVLGIALCSTNGPNEHKEESVVYWSLTYQHLCYRLLSEFLDGRFVPMEGTT